MIFFFFSLTAISLTQNTRGQEHLNPSKMKSSRALSVLHCHSFWLHSSVTFSLAFCSVQVSNAPDRDPPHQQHESPQGSRLQGQSAGTFMCVCGAGVFTALLKVQQPVAAAVLFIKAVLM